MKKILYLLILASLLLGTASANQTWYNYTVEQEVCQDFESNVYNADCPEQHQEVWSLNLSKLFFVVAGLFVAGGYIVKYWRTHWKGKPF